MSNLWNGGKVSVNGVVVEPSEAKISVFDRGFLYGDSVFETLRVYQGQPFAFAEHLERFFASGDRIGFTLPWSSGLIREYCGAVLQASGLNDAYLRVIGSRGIGAFGLDPNVELQAQLVIIVLPLPHLPAELYEKGRSACLVSVRRNLKMALDPLAKTGNYINSVLAVREARQRGADEAIMLNVEGNIAEASSANVFALIAGKWCTPPLETGILSGITRQMVLEICKREKIAFEIRALKPQQLQAAQEILLCSSVRELLPIVSLDNKPIGKGHVGQQFKRLRVLYQERVLE